MAEKKITYDSFIGDDAINKINKDYADMVSTIEKGAKVVEDSLKGVQKVSGKNIKTFDEQTKAIDAQLKKIQQLEKLEKQKLILEERLLQQKQKTLQEDEKTLISKKKLEQEDQKILIQKQRLEAAERRETQAKERASKAAEKAAKKNRIEAGSIKALQVANNKLLEKRRNVNMQSKKGQEEFKRLTKQIKKNEDQLKKYDAQIGRGQRNVGNYFKNIKQGITAAMGWVGAILAAAAGLVKLFKATQENAKLQGKIKKIYEAEGQALFNLTAQVRFLAGAMGETEEEILKASNALSKEFGINGAKALALIEDGFRKGADVNGEYLDTLKEYPAQLKAVGLSAEEALAIITQTAGEGVFSDKGIDAIKEAGLRLREMPAATRAALGQIGLSGSEIQRQLEDGSKTMFEVIQDVSSKMGQFGETSEEVGTVLADVFGGAGEDAGYRYITMLSGMSTEMDDIDSKLTDMQRGTLAFRKEWALLTQRVINGEGIIGSFFGKIMLGVSDLLKSLRTGAIADFFIDAANSVIKLNNEFGWVTGAIQFMWATLKTVGQGWWVLIKTVFIEPFLILKDAIKAALSGEDISDAITARFKGIKESFVKLGKDTAVNFKTAYENTINREPVELITKRNYDLEDEKIKEKGKILGKSFADNFEAGIKGRGDIDLGVSFDTDSSEDALLASMKNKMAKIQAIKDKAAADDLVKREENREVIKEYGERAFQDSADALSQINDANLAASQAKIDTATSEIESLSTILEQERSLQANGKANNVTLVEQQLEEQQKIKQKAIAENKKQQKAQQNIDAATQLSSIITAAANILKGYSALPFVGQVLGAISVGAMISGFVATQAKARAATQNFAEGTDRVTGAGTETSDSIPANLSKNERVVPAKENKRLLKANIKNGKLADLAILGKKVTEGKLTGWDMLNMNHSNITELHNSGMLAELRNGNEITKKLLNRPQYAINDNTIVSIDADGNIKQITKM